MGGCCLYRWSHKERQQRGDISCTADFIFCLPGAVTPADEALDTYGSRDFHCTDKKQKINK